MWCVEKSEASERTSREAPKWTRHSSNAAAASSSKQKRGEKKMLENMLKNFCGQRKFKLKQLERLLESGWGVNEQGVNIFISQISRLGRVCCHFFVCLSSLWQLINSSESQAQRPNMWRGRHNRNRLRYHLRACFAQNQDSSLIADF